MVYFPLVVVMFLVNCFADVPAEYEEDNEHLNVNYRRINLIVRHCQVPTLLCLCKESIGRGKLFVLVEDHLLLVRFDGVEGLQEAADDGRPLRSEEGRQIESSHPQVRSPLE